MNPSKPAGRGRNLTPAATDAVATTEDGWSLATRAEASLAAIRARNRATVTGHYTQEAAPDGHPSAQRQTKLDDICETLRQTEVFAHLGERQLRRLAEGCSQLSLPENHQVIRSGDPSDAVFVIREGSVNVLRDQRGKTHQRLAYLNAGDIFGELGVIHGVERGASVRTAEACRLVRIDQQTFRHFLKANAVTEAKVEALATQRHCYNSAAALDSRRDARIRIDAEITLLPAAEGSRLAHLEDISQTGLSITGAPAGWKPQEPVSFTLIAANRRLCVTGRIVWRRDDTVGLAFSGNIPGYDHQVTRFTRALLEALE